MAQTPATERSQGDQLGQAGDIKKHLPPRWFPVKARQSAGLWTNYGHRSAMIGPTGVRGKHSASCRLLFVLRCARMAPMEGDSNSSLWGLNVSWKLCVCEGGGGGGESP